MRQVLLAMAALGSLLLGDPAAAQQASAETIADSIPIGATKQDVESHYGAPTETALSEEGNEIWTYDIQELQVKNEGGLLSDLGFTSGNEAGRKSVRVFRVWFDRDGKVTAARALEQEESN